MTRLTGVWAARTTVYHQPELQSREQGDGGNLRATWAAKIPQNVSQTLQVSEDGSVCALLLGSLG